MRHGATPRSAHRAAPQGGPALLAWRDRGRNRGLSLPRPRRTSSRPAIPPRQPVDAAPRQPAGDARHRDRASQVTAAPAGQHRPPRRRRAPRQPQHMLQILMSGLGALIVLGICGLSGFFIVADERHGHGAAAASRTGNAAIATRRLDNRPLTLPEVFPRSEIRLAPGTAPYAIGMTHIDTDCDIAVTGRLGAVLSDHGCTQVVRASMTAPYGGYRVTAGVFNLADAVGAAQVGEQAQQLVETGTGTFAAMAAGGPGTDPLAQPPAQVGWHERGHYLVYCVISRPDGHVVSDADPYARRITADLIESYLGGNVLGRRSSGA